MAKLLGPFATSLRGSDFTDATGTAGVANTSQFIPLASFRVPLNQAFDFLPSTQNSAQQNYWAQNLVTTASGNPAAGSGVGIALERRDATGRLTLDIIDQGTVGDIPTPTNSVAKYQARYFTHRTVLAQDEYLYVTVKSVSGTTVAVVPTSDLLIRCQYYIKQG
jgi:hypothetical protein